MNDREDREKFDLMMKWAKDKMCDFRVDERRKVKQKAKFTLIKYSVQYKSLLHIQILGIRPFSKYPNKDTNTLANEIIRAIKGPTSVRTKYTQHLTLLVNIKVITLSSPRLSEL